MDDQVFLRSFDEPSDAVLLEDILAADTVNSHGARAYSLADEKALAMFACTGTFRSTYYTSGTEQIANVRKLAENVSPLRLAKMALMSRKKAFLRDMPVMLTALLYPKHKELWKVVFRRVVDGPGMLRNYARLVRSGLLGWKVNLAGQAHRRAIQEWFNNQSTETLFRGAVGKSPSLTQVVRWSHIRTDATPEKQSLMTYLFNRDYGWQHGFDGDALPSIVKSYERFKKDQDGDPPAVDFRYLDSLGLNREQWAEVFRRSGWQFVRSNLNTAARHKVFDVPGMTEHIAAKLSDPEAIRNSHAYPYQIFVAATMSQGNVPPAVTQSLHEAVEVALGNIPELEGRTAIAVDVSGSMGDPVTGTDDATVRTALGGRHAKTSVVRNVDLAALVASALLRRNNSARVFPFANGVKNVELEADAPVLDNAATLSKLLGGGTNCSAPIRLMNEQGLPFDNVVLLSDNESWLDDDPYRRRYSSGTAFMEQWQIFKGNNPSAKLFCVDFSPRIHSQVPEIPDVLQIAGWNDYVFDIMSGFARGGNSEDHWLEEIDKMAI